MSEHHYGLIRYACYAVNVSMSVISTLSPLLFIGFRELYGISFSLLGTLVLVNFCTQLAIDIFLSFYAGENDEVMLEPIEDDSEYERAAALFEDLFNGNIPVDLFDEEENEDE